MILTGVESLLLLIAILLSLHVWYDWSINLARLCSLAECAVLAYKTHVDFQEWKAGRQQRQAPGCHTVVWNHCKLVRNTFSCMMILLLVFYNDRFVLHKPSISDKVISYLLFFYYVWSISHDILLYRYLLFYIIFLHYL